MWIDLLIVGLVLAVAAYLVARFVRRRKAGRGGCACCGSGGCAACAGCGQPAPDHEKN